MTSCFVCVVSRYMVFGHGLVYPKIFCDVSNSMSHPLTNLIKLIQHTLLHESRFTATRCSLPFAMSY